MLESLKIIEQAIENIPAGPMNVDAGQRRGAARQAGRLSQHRRADPAFELIMPNRGFDGAARGSLRGQRIAQRRTGILHRRRRHDPRLSGPDPAAVVHPFRHVSAHDSRAQFSDVVAVLGSINIIAAELDR